MLVNRVSRTDRRRSACLLYSDGKGKRKQIEDQENDDHEGSITDPEDDSDHEPTPKKKKPTAPRKPRVSAGTTKKRGPKAKTKPTAEGAKGSVEKTDSPLFSEWIPSCNDMALTVADALQQPDIALQPLIDEWIETYQQAAGDETSEQKSIHELVVFFIRCCGMATEIEQAEATDDDGIPDVIERVQDESVRVALATYPLISKAKNFKPFKSNLNEFISHFISSLALTPIMFHTADNTPHSSLLIPLLLNWLMCMSSSTLRPIRHTSTYMTLKINSALCDVAADVSKDLSVKQRQRDAEIRKAGATNAAQKRMKAAEDRVKEVQERKQTLEELMQEIFDV